MDRYSVTLRIILADDHPIVRSGVRLLIESATSACVVAEAGSPEELFKALDDEPCDLVLTDFNMPGGQVADGLNMLSQLNRRWPKLPVIVLTMMSNIGVLRSILATGVRGLLNKSDALTELTLAIQAVSHGREYISAAIKAPLEATRVGESSTEHTELSARETEVLRLFASGLTVSQIAIQLNRSVKTISRQKMDAMSKLGLKSDLEVYAYAREHGMFS
jgi:two-component system, NarL family, captular synthesis response regulator RcsB